MTEALGHIVPLKVLVAVFVDPVGADRADGGRRQCGPGQPESLRGLAHRRREGEPGGALLHAPALRPAVPAGGFLGCLGFVVLFISLVLTDAAAYRPSLIPGEAPAMQKVHTPSGK